MKAPPAKSKGIFLRLSPEQYRLIQQRAERCGVRVAPWIRTILLQVAKKTGTPGVTSVREPDGVSF